jgi:hypothetical protein
LGERAEHREAFGAGRHGHGEADGSVPRGRGGRFWMRGGHSRANLGRGNGRDNPGHKVGSQQV